MTNTLSQLELAYIAGIIDGEGCIRIYKIRPGSPSARSLSPRYTLQVGLSMSELPVVSFIANAYGRNINQRQRGNKQDGTPLKVVYDIYWSSNLAHHFLLDIFPYLRGKADQARAGIEFHETKTRHYSGKKYTHLPTAEVEKRERYYQLLKLLKNGSSSTLAADSHLRVPAIHPVLNAPSQERGAI